MKRELLRDFSDTRDDDLKELIENIRKQGTIRLFNYPFYEDYRVESIQVSYDVDAGGYPYVMHYAGTEQHRIYFPVEWDKERIAKAYCQLLAEQDAYSPHCYADEEYPVKEQSVILDLGVAEGNFSVGMADHVKHIYLFEGDSIWWKPLELTFAQWKEKVTLIPKYVSDVDDEQYISLGTFLRDHIFRDDMLFLKMDIEGYEERVLRGCSRELKEMIQRGADVTMAVCCYHRQGSEAELREILSETGFSEIKSSKGFMILNNFFEERVYPYFRRGILFTSTFKQEKV